MPYLSQAEMQVHSLDQVEDVSALWGPLWPGESRLHLKEVTALRSKRLSPSGNMGPGARSSDLIKKG